MKLKVAVIVPVILVGVLFSWPAVKLVLGPAELPTLVPLPAKMERHRGDFTFHTGTRVIADPASQESAQYLADLLHNAIRPDLALSSQEGLVGKQGAIELTSRGAKPGL